MKLTKNILAVLVGVSIGLGGTAFAVTNVSLTKNRALQYLNYIADSFLIGGTATTSDARLSVVGSTTVTGTGIFGGELRVPYFTATSTTATSTFAGGLVTDNIVSLSSSTIQRLFSTSLIVATTTITAGRPLIVGGVAQVDRLIIQGLNSTNNAIDWNGGGGIHSDAGTLYIGGAGGSIYFRPSGHTSGTNQGNIDTTGRLYIGATGTPSLPAYVFQNNSNTGMFSSIPSFLQFSTNGKERMTLTSTGLVGIGTTSPYAKLSVVGQTVAEYFTATSTITASTLPYASTTAITTTATSTMGDIYSSAGLLSYARLNVTGAGTSTILTGALEALNFNMTGTATSTAAGGINITAGCFAVKGVCVGGGSAALTGGESGSFAYWTSASTLAATSSPVFPYFTATSTTATSTVKWRFSVGTSTSNEINFMPDVVGTSTFTSGYGLDLTNGGCYAIGGACVSGVLSVGGSNNDMMFKTGAQAISGSTGVSFAWDNTNKRLGIGSSTPYAQLTVGGDIWTGGLRASSTVMFGSNSTAFLWNSTNGHVGINGTTTPWGDLSIVASDDTPTPAFVGATTTGGITSWFWNSTSTKATNPFNWMFGTSSNRYNRNSFLVAGEVRSTFQNYTCEPYNALTADITADSPTITTSASQLCGGLMFDELTDGALYIATTSPIIASGRLISQSPMWAIRANELTTAAANEGYAIRMPRNIIGASSTPYLEVMVRKQVVQPAAVTNASSTLGFVGFETGALNATTRCGDGAGSIGCMGFVSSSTGNWMALTSSRTGVQTGTLTDTGVSSTTAGFINMRIEVENSGNRVKYLMRHTGADEWRLVAEHATNIPTLEVTPAIVIDADAASGARPDILGKGPIYWGYSVNGSTGY
jgi:hypothetical protein